MNISASKVYQVTSPRRWKASQDVKDHKRKPLGAGELKVGVHFTPEDCDGRMQALFTGFRDSIINISSNHIKSSGRSLHRQLQVSADIVDAAEMVKSVTDGRLACQHPTVYSVHYYTSVKLRENY